MGRKNRCIAAMAVVLMLTAVFFIQALLSILLSGCWVRPRTVHESALSLMSLAECCISLAACMHASMTDTVFRQLCMAVTIRHHVPRISTDRFRVSCDCLVGSFTRLLARLSDDSRAHGDEGAILKS